MDFTTAAWLLYEERETDLHLWEVRYGDNPPSHLLGTMHKFSAPEADVFGKNWDRVAKRGKHGQLQQLMPVIMKSRLIYLEIHPGIVRMSMGREDHDGLLPSLTAMLGSMAGGLIRKLTGAARGVGRLFGVGRIRKVRDVVEPGTPEWNMLLDMVIHSFGGEQSKLAKKIRGTDDPKEQWHVDSREFAEENLLNADVAEAMAFILQVAGGGRFALDPDLLDPEKAKTPIGSVLTGAGLEGFIVTAGDKLGIPIKGLEGGYTMTRDSVFSAFRAEVEDIAERRFAAVLRRMARGDERAVPEVVFEIYVKGKQRLIKNVSPLGAYDRQRNLTHFRGSLQEAKQGGVLIAVGAAHMPGRLGLVQLFKDAGFTVTRMGYTSPVPAAKKKRRRRAAPQPARRPRRRLAASVFTQAVRDLSG